MEIIEQKLRLDSLLSLIQKIEFSQEYQIGTQFRVAVVHDDGYVLADEKGALLYCHKNKLKGYNLIDHDLNVVDHCQDLNDKFKIVSL